MDLPCRSLRPRRSARAGQSGWRGHRAGPERLGLTSLGLETLGLESLSLERLTLERLGLERFSLAGLAGALLLTLLPPLPARSAAQLLSASSLFSNSILSYWIREKGTLRPAGAGSGT
jgi:hypothetical protein